MKFLSHPGHGKSRCCISGSWSCFSSLNMFLIFYPSGFWGQTIIIWSWLSLPHPPLGREWGGSCLLGRETSRLVSRSNAVYMCIEEVDQLIDRSMWKMIKELWSPLAWTHLLNFKCAAVWTISLDYTAFTRVRKPTNTNYSVNVYKRHSPPGQFVAVKCLQASPTYIKI